MTDGILDYLIGNDVACARLLTALSTSMRRTGLPVRAWFLFKDRFLDNNINESAGIPSSQPFSLLPADSLPHAKEIIDSYVRMGSAALPSPP